MRWAIVYLCLAVGLTAAFCALAVGMQEWWLPVVILGAGLFGLVTMSSLRRHP